MRRRQRLSVLTCTVLRAAGLPPLRATSQERQARIGSRAFEENPAWMGAVGLLADAISGIQKFVWVFVLVYGLVIFAYILMSWIRMPYSVWMSRVQNFLRD